ncbi:MAG: 2,3,4,5-tetrahydropyridine-2,6-dicarboxylate N-acetyltransferase [Ligilactobacillus acidipiscis]|jgi:2,3,4,5-tetrahydropyridine-2,6-dicarboxylate N-acetyltransferase|nr:2,3,4,5-tetrahydropyridine-2,6-dicarboxylate N-acetyltransferase [Ligilactobacillus acidipiscis]MCI1954133.1 2,3,4,5-tetrahydropyridine-2,6-dicarboxylate N-acetyltransferase [Ligilactobacillus acidipiscis]
MAELDAQKIIATIANSEKKTPVKAYIKGDLKDLEFPSMIDAYVGDQAGVIFGDWADVQKFLNSTPAITKTQIETSGRNTGVPLADEKKYNARIEPGAIIRDQVEIGDQAVIMMGAVINIGAEIGAGTMIDMGAILGGRALVGNHCHIGAGTVLAGVVEPASAKPVTIEDDVLIGANAVILEGVTVGKGAVVGAGSVVTNDVAANSVVAGVPAKKIKNVTDVQDSKVDLVDDLRKL